MKQILFITLTLIGLTNIFAQNNPQATLDRAAKLVTENNGISIRFHIKNIEEKKQTENYSQSGQIWIRGNQFKINTQDATIWFNGSSLWTLLKGTNEVNISTPDEEELAEISPISIINTYKSGFKITSKGSSREQGEPLTTIELTPTNKQSHLTRYLIKINTQSNQIKNIVISAQNGNNTYISLQKYQPIPQTSTNIFTFNPKEYPHIEIIDLR